MEIDADGEIVVPKEQVVFLVISNLLCNSTICSHLFSLHICLFYSGKLI